MLKPMVFDAGIAPRFHCSFFVTEVVDSVVVDGAEDRDHMGSGTLVHHRFLQLPDVRGKNTVLLVELLKSDEPDFVPLRRYR